MGIIQESYSAQAARTDHRRQPGTAGRSSGFLGAYSDDFDRIMPNEILNLLSADNCVCSLIGGPWLNRRLAILIAIQGFSIYIYICVCVYIRYIYIYICMVMVYIYIYMVIVYIYIYIYIYMVIVYIYICIYIYIYIYMVIVYIYIYIHIYIYYYLCCLHLFRNVSVKIGFSVDRLFRAKNSWTLFLFWKCGNI